MDPRVVSRGRGAILGAACGEALGLQQPAERDWRARVTTMEMVGGRFGLAAGEWGSTTALSLAIAESYALVPGNLSLRDLADRWVALVRGGEHSCSGTLADAGVRTTLALLALSGGQGEQIVSLMTPGDGPGAMARAVPVAIRHMHRMHCMDADAARQALMTHTQGAAVLAQVFSLLVSGVVVGLADLRRFRELPSVQRAVARGQTALGGGHALNVYEDALWFVANADGPEAAISRSALWSRSPSVPVVVGALSGALWGVEALPARWLERLAWRARLTMAADALCHLADQDLRELGPGPRGSLT